MGEFIPPTDGKVTAKSNSDTFVPPTDSVELKKKDESKPTSTPQKSGSGTPTGSSGGVKSSIKSFDGFSPVDLKKMNSPEIPLPKVNKKVEAVINSPENIAKRKELQKKEILKYRANTKLSEQEKQDTQADLLAKTNQEGIWNNIKAGTKDFLNTASDFVLKMTDEGATPEDLKINTDPFADEKKEAIESLKMEGIKSPKKEDINAKAKQIYVDNINLEKKQQKINTYLENVDPQTKSTLKIDADERFKTLSKDKKDITNRIGLNQTYFEQLTADLENSNLSENDRLELTNERNKIIKYLDSDYKKFTTTNSELGTAQDEFDAFKRNYNAFDNTVSRAVSSIANAGVSLYSGANYVANMLGANEEYKQEGIKEAKEFLQEKKDSFRPDNKEITLDNFFQYSTDLLANQTGTLSQVATGGIFGAALLGVEGAGDKYSEMFQAQKNGKNYTPAQMAITPFVSGLSTAILSELPTISTLRNSANVWRSALKETAGKELIDQAIKTTGKSIAKNIAKDTGKEMSTELADNIVQNAINRDILGDKKVGYFDNSIKTLKDTALLTGMIGATGAIPHVAISAVKTFTDKANVKAMDINAKKIAELSKQLDNENISEATKTVIEQQITKATKESSEIINKTIDKMGEMPLEKIETVYENSKKISEIQQKAVDVKEDFELDDVAKKTVLDGLKEEYKTLDDENTTIINETNEQTPPTPEAQPQAEVPQQAEAEKVETPPVEDVVAPSVEGRKYNFTKTPSLENAQAVDIKDANIDNEPEITEKIINNQEHWDKALVDGVKNEGNGWFEVGKTIQGESVLHAPSTNETVVIKDSQNKGGRNSAYKNNFIENNPRNEATPETNTPIDGNVQLGASNVGESGNAKPKSNSKSSVPSSVDGGEVKGDASVGGNNNSWDKEFQRAKSENDLKALDVLYDKVKVMLNGIAQKKGEETVKYFQDLKNEIKNYSIELKKTAETPQPKSKGDVEVSPFAEFEKVVNESKSVDEAFDKIKNIQGVSSETSKSFRDKYDPKGELSTKEAFGKFYDDVKGKIVEIAQGDTNVPLSNKKEGGVEDLKFTTHTGEQVSGKRLSDALNKVADDWAKIQRGIRKEDKYADHVSEKTKEENLTKGLERAEEIRNGKNIDNFTIWQRINTELTGESVPLFSPEKPKPTTKEKIAERIKLSDAKVDNIKDALNGIDSIFGIKIKVDDIEGLNKNGIDIVEVIANIAKQAIAAGIHIDEAISKTIEHLKKTIDFDVNIDEIKERINPKKEAEPQKPESKESSKDMEDFRDSWNLDPSSDEINQYDSGRTIAREHGETRNNQDYEVQKDFARVQIGIRAIEHAKRLFGAEYVEKTLSFIEQANLSPEKKAVAYVLLENEMDARVKEFPKNVGVQKLQDLVRAKSQEFLANSARAMGAGRFRIERFRELAKNGFSEEEFTNAILTTKQKNDKGKIQKLIQVSPDDINNESENQESDEDFVIEEPTVKRNKEAVKKDISNVLAQMRKDLLKVAKGNAAMSSIPYAAQLQAVAPHIIKLSKLLAELGGMTTRQIVNEVYNDIKEVFPGINKTDVSDILKEHSIKKAKPKTEAQEKQDSVKEIVKKALIEKGFSREITVTKNERDASGKLVKDADGRNVKTKEKRTVLDWKKLAGEAGTISNIRKNVEESLKGSKYSKAEINEMKKALEREYVRLTSDVIEKGLNELQNRNADRKPVNTKSAAKKLAELYNYGLFEKNKDSYEKIINSVLGFNGLDQMAFDEMKEIARGYAVLMDSGLSDTEIKSAVNSLSRRQSRLVATLAFSQADWKFKLAVALSEITNLSTRFKLVNLGNLAENISSGMMARAANNMMDAMANIASGKKTSNKAIKAQSKINARAKLRGITLEAAESYGDTSSLLLNHSAVEDYFNNATTNRVYHAIISTYMAKPVLEGADSYNKILITEAKMVRATIKVLEAKGMSNSDALDYVAKAITGDSMKEALVKAKALIEKVNEDAGRKLLNDSESSIKSLAADIVKESLVSGGQLTETELKAIYAAAYKSAGKDIGHVSNNWVTDQISAKGAQIEKKVADAIKEKKWSNAAGAVVNQIIWKNFISTFVGGGTNWFVKGLQKSANPLSLVSLRDDVMQLKMAGKLDVTTDEGIKNMEESLYRGMNLRSTSATMLMGAIITASIIGGMSASGADDEIEKWLKENKWAKKYFDKTVPDAVVLILAIKDKDFGRYIAKMVNVKADFFDDQKNTYKILEKYAKGYTENDEVKISEASGDLGAMLGKRFEFPGPVRAAKDVKQIYKGLVKGEYDKTNYYTSGFLNGFFQGGIVESFGLRKDPDFEEKSKSSKKGVPGVPNFGRMKINP